MKVYVSFAPLAPDAAVYISEISGIDFTVATHSPNWLCCTAREQLGPHDYWPIMGVLACEFRHPFDAHFNVAITDQRCMSRRLLRAIFTALFSQAVRVSAEVDPSNSRAIHQMQRMGFEIEGYLRKGYDGRRDAIVYGMLAEDCKYLNVSRETPKEARHGQGSEGTRPLRSG